MSPHSIYKIFDSWFPNLSKRVERRVADGPHGIRVRLNDKREYLFIYNSADDWSLGTYRHTTRKKQKET